MKFDVYSDLHLDAWIRYYRDSATNWWDRFYPESSCAIIAGDLANGFDMNAEFFDRISKYYDHIIYTPGNHEYYYPEYNKTRLHDPKNRFIRDLINIDERDLSLSAQTINGIKIVTATLWSNFWNDKHYSIDPIKYINDFRFIPELFLSNDPAETMIGWYNRSVEFLLEHKDADIVVTHFAPTMESIHPMYEGNALNPYFCNNDRNLLEEMSPKFWIHGHTHSQLDYFINNTRVICHPIGYPKENMSSLQILPKVIQYE